jgi:hypothetical protein
MILIIAQINALMNAKPMKIAIKRAATLAL